MELEEKTLLAQELARTIAQFWRVARKRGSYQGIKQSEFMALHLLIHACETQTEGVKVSDLSAQLQITSAGVTHLITSLENGGFVERHTDPSDRRVVLVRPTPAGIQLVKEAHEQHFKYLVGLVGYLGQEDSKELIRLLSATSSYAQKAKLKSDTD